MPIPAVHWSGSIMVATAKSVMPWHTRSWPVSATRVTESCILEWAKQTILCTGGAGQFCRETSFCRPLSARWKRLTEREDRLCVRLYSGAG